MEKSSPDDGVEQRDHSRVAGRTQIISQGLSRRTGGGEGLPGTGVPGAESG